MEYIVDADQVIEVVLGCETSVNCADCPVIRMDPDVETFIRETAAASPDMEIGGVLLGSVLTNKEGTELVVQAALEALYSESSPMSLTFTHETWQEINLVKDERFPDLKIVGWYHSHPGLGIFLSGMDEFIHRNFFNLPWQIAYVIDPVSKEQGIFRWEDGSLVEVSQ